MGTDRRSEEGFTRREFVYTGGAGIVGLAVGAGIGYAVTPKGEETAATTSEPIVVGGAYPLTGYSAGDGEEMLRGLQLGVEEVNSAGGLLGRELVVESGDIESELAADKISNVFQRLISANASVICMGYADYTNSSWKVPAKSGVPVMHTNTFTGNTEFVAENMDTYGMVFQTCPTEVWYGSGFADYLKRLQDTGAFKPNKKTAAILTSTDPYSLNIAKTFRGEIEKEGWKIVVNEEFTAPLSEWGPMLAKIRDTEPGLVFHADYLVGDLASFTKQFRASPTPSLLYEQYGPSVPEYLELTGEAANGVLWSTVIGMLQDDAGLAYAKKFTDKFSAAPGWSQAAAQRDQVWLWSLAAGMAGDPKEYQKVVTNMRNGIYRGICGIYHFYQRDNAIIPYPDDTTDASLGMPHLTFQIQAQEHKVVDPSPYDQSSFELPPWMG